jgi:hypothetical protein
MAHRDAHTGAVGGQALTIWRPRNPEPPNTVTRL